MKRMIFAILALLLLALLAGLYWSYRHSQAPSSSAKLWTVAFTEPDKKNSDPALAQTLCSWLSQTQKDVELAAFEINLPCVKETLLHLHQDHKTVRIVTDSDHVAEIKELKQAGIPVVEDHRRAFMHNKFLIRDGQEVWTGSLNLTENGVQRNNNNVIRLRDTGVAKLYRAEFDELFGGAFGPSSPRQKLPALFSFPDLQVEVLFSPEDPVRERILDLLHQARQSIYFMAFSFTDDKMGKALAQQAQAGVEIHGVFEKRGSTSKYSEYGRLKKLKLDVHQDGNPGILHHKVFILDRKIVITGSYNFSKNADRSNDENLMVLHNPEIAQRYLEEYQRVASLAH